MATRPVSVSRALTSALKAVETAPEDEAVVALAKRYAAAIDSEARGLAGFGKELLATLSALGMTPAARKAVAAGVTPVQKGGERNDGGNTLVDLRQRAAERRARTD